MYTLRRTLYLLFSVHGQFDILPVTPELCGIRISPETGELLQP